MFVSPPSALDIKSANAVVVYILQNRVNELDPYRLRQKEVLPALDKNYEMSNIGSENMRLIAANDYNEFYENKLNVRRKFFGRKSTREILTYKSSKINSPSLLQLEPKESTFALSHFEDLTLFIKDQTCSVKQYYSKDQGARTSVPESRIRSLLKYSQGSSEMLKNEMLT